MEESGLGGGCVTPNLIQIQFEVRYQDMKIHGVHWEIARMVGLDA